MNVVRLKKFSLQKKKIANSCLSGFTQHTTSSLFARLHSQTLLSKSPAHTKLRYNLQLEQNPFGYVQELLEFNADHPRDAPCIHHDIFPTFLVYFSGTI
jgi:hypothetical protein